MAILNIIEMQKLMKKNLRISKSTICKLFVLLCVPTKKCSKMKKKHFKMVN